MHEGSGIKYPCGECDFQTTSQLSLKVHTQAIHRGIKFPCVLCGFEFSAKASMQKHMKSIHEGIRALPKYECNDCEYKTTRTDHLKNHIQKIHQMML